MLGAKRYEEVLQPVTGKALPLRKGEVLRLEQIHGGQCIDFNAFNLHDYKERMSVGHSRQTGLHLHEADVLVSNPPRNRPMLHISHMSESCVADTLGARCDRVLFERLMGFEAHTNCQDTFAEAIREFGLSPDDTHDSFNMFMNTRWNDEGDWWIERNSGKAGDYVDLLACIDTLCVPIVCGSGDVQLTSNFALRPIRVVVFESTPESLQKVEQVEAKYSAPRSRKTLSDFKIKDIKTQRELTPDPNYKPSYLNSPIQWETITTPLPASTVKHLEIMVDAGFESDVPSVVRRLFMEWYLNNHTRDSGDQRKSLFQGGLK